MNSKGIRYIITFVSALMAVSMACSLFSGSDTPITEEPAMQQEPLSRIRMISTRLKYPPTGRMSNLTIRRTIIITLIPSHHRMVVLSLKILSMMTVSPSLATKNQNFPCTC